jgi:sensor histidine kinase YesM
MRRFFVLILAFSAFLALALTAITVGVSSHYLSGSAETLLQNQTNQALNIFEEQLATLENIAIAAQQQLPIRNLITGAHVGYRIFNVYRDSYNYLHVMDNCYEYTDMAVFIPRKRYVMSAAPGNVSSDFDIYSSPHTRWVELFTDELRVNCVTADFFPPVTGGSDQFAYIMAVKAANDWVNLGFIAVSLDKRAIDILLADTLFTTVSGQENEGFLIILDETERIVYASRKGLDDLRSFVPDPDYFALRGGDFADGSLSGHYVVSRMSAYGGLRFVSFAPKRDMNARIAQLQMIVLGSAALGIILLTVGALTIARRFTKPIFQIIGFLREAERNEFSTRLDIDARDEIRELADSINAMSEAVRKNQILRRRAEFDALQKQIDPHFLFNTLETMKALAIMGDSRKVCGTIDALSGIFRYTTNRQAQYTVQLAEETGHAADYLRIQATRFAGRLRFTLNVPDELADVRTLRLILQPLAENAIRHALERVTGEILVEISVQMNEDSDVEISVADNGPGIPLKRYEELTRFISAGQDWEGKPPGMGIGLKNIHERLALYYGPRYGLSVHRRPEGGTLAKILIPPQRDEATAAAVEI